MADGGTAWPSWPSQGVVSGASWTPLQQQYQYGYSSNGGTYTFPIQVSVGDPQPVSGPPEPKELSPTEWLREQVAEITEYARA